MNSQVAPPLAGSFRLGVFDTSVLTSDVVSALGRGEPSSILAGMQHGTLRGYIPHYVWAEVPRVLADRKREGGAFDFRAAEALWNTAAARGAHHRSSDDPGRRQDRP